MQDSTYQGIIIKETTDPDNRIRKSVDSNKISANISSRF